MPRFTNDQLAQITAKPSYKVVGSGVRPNPKFQEHKEVLAGKDDNRPRRPKAKGSDHPSYRLTVTFLFSDRRRRDLDGCLATIADSLIAARRRLLDGNP